MPAPLPVPQPVTRDEREGTEEQQRKITLQQRHEVGSG
ncbi:MAG: hypothetical protein QOG39_925, partial [Acidimicrobiaceae bacterium]